MSDLPLKLTAPLEQNHNSTPTKLNHHEIKQTVIWWLIVTSLFFLLASLLPKHFPFLNGQAGDKGIPLIIEDWDMAVYWREANWWRQGIKPYYGSFFTFKDNSWQVFIPPVEYPQLALTYFTIPSFFANNFETYRWLMFTSNALCLLSLLLGTRLLLKINQQNQRRILWLIILPSFIFFTFNRYDILPTTITIWSLIFLLNKYYKLSFFTLTLAILTKVYPILLLPLYLLVAKNNQQKLSPLITITALTLFIPLISCATWTGIIPTLGPYLAHIFREPTVGSPLRALYHLGFYYPWVTNLIFLLIQLAIPLVIIYGLISKKRWVVNTNGIIILFNLIILLFILFNKFYSPQWILWFLPTIITVVPNYYLGNIIIPYDLLNYLLWPLLGSFKIYIYKTLPYNSLTLIRTSLLVIMVGYLIYLTCKFNLLKFNPSIYENHNSDSNLQRG